MKRNHEALNDAALALLRMGHIPFVGVNAALPVLENYSGPDKYEKIMLISMAMIDKCDALLLIGESPGANREMNHVKGKALPVYHSIGEIRALE